MTAVRCPLSLNVNEPRICAGAAYIEAAAGTRLRAKQSLAIREQPKIIKFWCRPVFFDSAALSKRQ